jgi:hypothetical protein
MSKKWAHLIETEDKLRKLERAWKTSGSKDDKDAYVAELIRGAQHEFLWDAYTLPMLRDIIKLMKRPRQHNLRSWAGYFNESWMGAYRPSKDTPEARVTARAFRKHNIESLTDTDTDTGEKLHLYGRIHIVMEFGSLSRAMPVNFYTPHNWRCDGKVELWTFGPETDWTDFETSTPNKKHHYDVKKWQAKELLDMLYEKMHKACKWTNLFNRFGFTKGKLNIPDDGIDRNK